MPRIWLFASAMLATAGLWHGLVRVEAAAATSRLERQMAQSQRLIGESAEAATPDCPFLKAHPQFVAKPRHERTNTVCPFSGRSGRSSISLDDALRMHTEDAIDPGDNGRDKAIWL